jgi:hypothetical protein
VGESLNPVRRKLPCFFEQSKLFETYLTKPRLLTPLYSPPTQDELRRIEEIRRQGEEKIKEDYRRTEELRKAEDARRAIEAAKLEEISEEARKLEAIEAALGLGSEKGLAVEKGLGVEKGFETGEVPGMEGETRESKNGRAAGLGFEEGGEVLGPDAGAVPEKYECVVAHPGALCELLDTTIILPDTPFVSCWRYVLQRSLRERVHHDAEAQKPARRSPIGCWLMLFEGPEIGNST